MTRLSPVLFVAVAVAFALLPACKDRLDPERACSSYMELRKKNAWPADDAVERACVKDLEAAKKGEVSRYARTVNCLDESDMTEVNKCLRGRTKDAEMKLENVLEAAGAWASTKPTKLTAEQCNDGAYYIASRKEQFGLLKAASLRQDHEQELVKACTAQASDPAYIEQFACMRRMKTQADLAQCSSAASSGARGSDSPAVIEKCVTYCRGRMGSNPNSPDYQACFHGCKANGGPT